MIAFANDNNVCLKKFSPLPDYRHPVFSPFPSSVCDAQFGTAAPWNCDATGGKSLLGLASSGEWQTVGGYSKQVSLLQQLSALSGSSQNCLSAPQMRWLPAAFWQKVGEEKKTGAVTISNCFCQLGHRLFRQPNAHPQYATGSSCSSALTRTRCLRSSPRGLTGRWQGGSLTSNSRTSRASVRRNPREGHRPQQAAESPRLPHTTTPLVSAFLKGAVSHHGSPEGEPIRTARQVGQRRQDQQGQEMSPSAIGAGRAGAGKATLACCSRASAIHGGIGAAPLLPAGRPLSGPGRAAPRRPCPRRATHRPPLTSTGPPPPHRRHFRRGRACFRDGPRGAEAAAWRWSAAACPRLTRRRPSEPVPRRRSSMAPASRRYSGTLSPPGRVRRQAGRGAAVVAGGPRPCPRLVLRCGREVKARSAGAAELKGLSGEPGGAFCPQSDVVAMLMPIAVPPPRTRAAPARRHRRRVRVPGAARVVPQAGRWLPEWNSSHYRSGDLRLRCKDAAIPGDIWCRGGIHKNLHGVCWNIQAYGWRKEAWRWSKLAMGVILEWLAACVPTGGGTAEEMLCGVNNWWFSVVGSFVCFFSGSHSGRSTDQVGAVLFRGKVFMDLMIWVSCQSQVLKVL